MKLPSLIFVFILSLLLVSAASATDQISVSGGESLHDDAADYYRVAYGFGLSDDLYRNEYTLIEAYLDLAVSVWDYSDDVVAVSVSPVLRLKPQNIESNFKPFIDISAGGPTYISETTFAGRELDTHLQFENRVGLGIEYGKTSVSINGIHYSNAGAGKHNEGTDWIVGTFSIDF